MSLKSVKTLSAKELAKKWKMNQSTINSLIDAGAKVEHEHDKSMKNAKEIARDHIGERPDYYKKLRKLEKTKISMKEGLSTEPERDSETIGDYTGSSRKVMKVDEIKLPKVPPKAKKAIAVGMTAANIATGADIYDRASRGVGSPIRDVAAAASGLPGKIGYGAMAANWTAKGFDKAKEHLRAKKTKMEEQGLNVNKKVEGSISYQSQGASAHQSQASTTPANPRTTTPSDPPGPRTPSDPPGPITPSQKPGPITPDDSRNRNNISEMETRPLPTSRNIDDRRPLISVQSIKDRLGVGMDKGSLPSPFPSAYAATRQSTMSPASKATATSIPTAGGSSPPIIDYDAIKSRQSSPTTPGDKTTSGRTFTVNKQNEIDAEQIGKNIDSKTPQKSDRIDEISAELVGKVSNARFWQGKAPSKTLSHAINKKFIESGKKKEDKKTQKEETTMDTKNLINEALDDILDNNLVSMKENLMAALQEKAMEKIEEKKKDIAANYFAQ